MGKLRPAAGTEYAAEPNAEFRAHRVHEAARSLARYLGTTEMRAGALLRGDEAALSAELRARRADPAVARRQLERRLHP